MNYLTYPTNYMNITQSYLGASSHYNNYHGFPQDFPIDEASKDQGRSYFYCPCDAMIVKRIYGVGGKGTNTIWLQSVDQVTTPKFTDYVTILIMHPNDDTLQSLTEGQIFHRGDAVCLEGNDGNATGYHFHISVSRGKFIYPGWQKNSAIAWVINGDAQKPEDCFYLDPNFTKVLNSKNLIFKLLPSTLKVITPILRDETKNQIEITIDNLRVRDKPNGTILGYANRGIYNIISSQELTDYTWYQVEENKWLAYDSLWANLYSISLIENIPHQQLTYIYTASKNGDYLIKLYQGEEVYIKNKHEET